jgi:hypothetical protein
MLILSIMCLMSVSCRSVDPSLYTLHRDSVAYTLHQRVDTLILCDTVYRHDSVIYRERTVLDTVYITKEVYRDRLHSTLNSQLSTLADTIHIVEYRDRVIEHPPERYVPKFYRCCAWALGIIVLLAIGYALLKFRV